ncbi:purine and uridine phosphorylase [Colletotrichum caudatum]|nr:purine and uridine phosphorylase [Colletotrichum caudatum]
MAGPPPRKEDFQIAIISALPVEYDAAQLIFDEFWSKDEGPRRRPSGGSGYVQTGRIGNDNAVLCLLPDGGEASAAMTASRLVSTYTGIKLAILAGTCSGVPSPRTDNEILLGDVVISESVVPLDRHHPGGSSRNYTLNDGTGRGPRTISAIAKSPFGLISLRIRTFKMLEQLQKTEAGHPTYYHRPAADEDVLFEARYPHQHRGSSGCSCSEGITCAEGWTASLLRKRLGYGKSQRPGEKETVRSTPEPRIHVGLVASWDYPMISGGLRDMIAGRYGAIAFEREAAGVRDKIPCVVIKGVCDYADGHKGDESWRGFAAAMAASATRAFLESHEQAEEPTAGASSGIDTTNLDNSPPDGP